ncbi:hypothetical protein C8Q76DRAFT_98681 [Earliella scabrosa]|nr:hypothetical protein C8Q76DRAFT_98681 [Earliella scabrosa]
MCVYLQFLDLHRWRWSFSCSTARPQAASRLLSAAVCPAHARVPLPAGDQTVPALTYTLLTSTSWRVYIRTYPGGGTRELTVDLNPGFRVDRYRYASRSLAKAANLPPEAQRYLRPVQTSDLRARVSVLNLGQISRRGAVPEPKISKTLFPCVTVL